MTEWKKIGVVGVDSGQLIICDPSYLKWWKKGEYEDIREYRDKESGKIYKYGKDFDSYEQEIKELGLTPNNLIHDLKQWIRIHYEPEFEFSYNYVSHKKGKSYKQIPFHLGHDGLAVSFDSGFGDGLYPVYAKIEDGIIMEIRVDMSG